MKLDEYIKSGKKSIRQLSDDSGIHRDVIYQLRHGMRPYNPYYAVNLEIGTDGLIKAEEICPDFFDLAKKIGFFRGTRQRVCQG